MVVTIMTAKVIVIFLLCVLYQNIDAQDLIKLISNEGYLAEEHFVTTKDGYILGLHRIPGSKKAAANNATKPPVLLQHGLATSSDCWILSGRKSALAFQLSDRGYDVWMVNSRGTVWSMNHTRFNLSDSGDLKKFYRYSFHEKGNEDLLSSIEYVLKRTGKEDLALYAHSEGASMFYALGATKPDALKKINSFYGFAPLVFIGNSNSTILKIAAFMNQFYLFEFIYDFGKPIYDIVMPIIKLLASNMITRGFATIPIKFIAGGADGQIAGSTISRLYQYFPSNVNKQSLSHFLQLVSSKRFKRYTPPIWTLKFWLQLIQRPFSLGYDLKKVDVPMYLYFSQQDKFINVNNLPLFGKYFNRKPKVFNVHNNFGHYDFVYGKDAYKVYELTYNALKAHTRLKK